jgi:macrolide transport system ATP-binding/permease protein
VLENVSEDAAYPQHICRAVLSNLYMTKDDMFKPVSVLSGGEKVKTALAKVLVSGCNFMILDEPTNHMDVYTMEGLEHLLESYDGTLLAISHDRTFISHTGDVVCRLEHGDIQKSTEQ